MNVAIIAAAGQGTRAGGGRAKQFRELGGIPIIIHTLRRFEQSATVGETIVVLPAGEAAGFLALAGRYGLSKLSRVVTGGPTRTESIWRGLQSVRAATAEIIAVHDGVRPFVTAEEIDRTMRAAQNTGAAILATPSIDTLKEVSDGSITRTLPRARIWHALTPQCFRYDILRRAYEKALAENSTATDDSALVEQLGVAVAIVEGHARNIKITRPADIAVAEIIFKESQV
ncbi:MAG TPA: 2-C-methyl-D-erythritol 4-phosphate cytidylyltransferase [Pyrinomonadaceae bacterium]|jgi:2-C-methyl-D-erythritol 4-phosphate cytidylyltransferase|nr:2-C-methyl-D-erythritol 4-phosphate cytidylyltransferase [Pyrinomonadaceae bacterium]